MKKQILTFAVLATMAAGAAIASNKTVAPNARLSTDSSPSCNTNVACHISEVADCANEEQVQYLGANPISGICDQPMAFD